MAFDSGLAFRVSELLATTHGMNGSIREKHMFGGLAYLCHNHLFLGIVGDRLMVRVGKAANALAQPCVTEMDFSGKPLTGYVYVSQDGLAEDDMLAAWVAQGLKLVSSLPPKVK